MAQNTLSAQSAERPIYLFDVSKTIRSFGQIWLIQKLEFGMLFRISVGEIACRVVVLNPFATVEAVTIPDEKNSQLHVVRNLDELTAWLNNLKKDL